MPGHAGCHGDMLFCCLYRRTDRIWVEWPCGRWRRWRSGFSLMSWSCCVGQDGRAAGGTGEPQNEEKEDTHSSLLIRNTRAWRWRPAEKMEDDRQTSACSESSTLEKPTLHEPQNVRSFQLIYKMTTDPLISSGILHQSTGKPFALANINVCASRERWFSTHFDAKTNQCLALWERRTAITNVPEGSSTHRIQSPLVSTWIRSWRH